MENDCYNWKMDKTKSDEKKDDKKQEKGKVKIEEVNAVTHFYIH